MRNHFLAFILFPFGLPTPLTASQPRPNIVVILADDLGYGDLSFYRQDPKNPDAPTYTPHLDSIAAQGVKFTQAYATQMCSPSRASLLTGKYPQRFGFYNNGDSHVGLPKPQQTFANLFKSAGYATACIGKWHVGNKPGYRPLERGFDRFYGFLGAAHDYFKPDLGTDTDGALEQGSFVYSQNEPVKQMKYLTEQFADEAIDFINSSHNKGVPFCLYLPFSAPHGPNQAEPAADREFARVPHTRNPERTRVRAMLDSLDKNIGRITRELFLLGIERDTVVVFASDNGGNEYEQPDGIRTVEHNGGLRGRKFMMWEGGIRVPMMIRWKGTVPEGGIVNGTCNLFDIFATIAGAADIAIPNEYQVDAVDLLPYAKGQRTGSPHEFIHSTTSPKENLWSVRKGPWKLVHDADSVMLPKSQPGQNKPTVISSYLFNIEEDSGERRNLIDLHPEIASALNQAHERFLSGCPPSIAEEQKRDR